MAIYTNYIIMQVVGRPLATFSAEPRTTVSDTPKRLIIRAPVA